ncbi:type I-A CRISPR-associated protein Cas7/Csa2 [Sulfurisphaera javensis]|uniref:Type I-A CRISPR-associated protein Cas7/Csa2 n=1 Tax=Sulfurisphaera javensis TaxID=2049879 RepID=A0AAT9GV72_9CREN
MYIRISGRFTSQISVLTGSENLGNYNTVASARVVVNIGGGYKQYEVPVLTGNALKHWHAVYLAQAYVSLNGKLLNEICERGIGLRGYKVDTKLSDNLKNKEAENEAEAILDVCNDIHGFLLTTKQIKRDSLVKVSFASPVFNPDILEYTSRFAITHNRVDPLTRGSNQTQMMVFKQEESSGPEFGFNISMNMNYVMKPMYTDDVEAIKEYLKKEKIDEEEERKRRIKASIMAVSYLLTGVGSKQARSLGILKPLELIAAISTKPLPNLIHGSYEDYVTSSISLLNLYAKTYNETVYILCYNSNCQEQKSKEEGKQGTSGKLVITNETSIDKFFEELINYAIGSNNK